MKKKYISLLLLTIIVLTSLFTFVACNQQIDSEEQWTEALQEFVNAEVFTITYSVKTNMVMEYNFSNTQTIKSKESMKIVYDFTNLKMYAEINSTSNSTLFNGEKSTYKRITKEYCEVVGSTIVTYNYSNIDGEVSPWEKYEEVFNSQEEAIERLLLRLSHYTYVLPINKTNVDRTYQYADFERNSIGQYVNSSDNYSVKLSFSNGKLTSLSSTFNNTSETQLVTTTSEGTESMKIKYRGTVNIPSSVISKAEKNS